MSEEKLRAVTAPLKGAVLFGLAAGAARIVYHVAMRTFSGDFLWTDNFVIWFAPLGHVVLFCVPAAVLATVAFFAPRLVAQRLVTGFFIALAIFSFLLLFPRIHHLASLALAIGIAVQLSGRVVQSPAWQTRRWMRAGAAIVAVSVLGMLFERFSRSRSERQAIAALPAAREDAPNVLVLVIDAGRAQTMDLYGYGKPTTPNIARLGAQGVIFDRAIATTSWTLPSIASMMTGEYPTSLSVDWLSPLDGSLPTLPEELRERGYLTGVFSGNLNYLTSETGLDRGVIRFRDFRTSFMEVLLTVPLAQSTLAKDLRIALRSGNAIATLRSVAAFNWARSTSELTHERKPVEAVAQEFLDWHSDAGERPWFALLNFFDAHAPYKPQPPFDSLYGRLGLEGAYAGAIATIDRQIGSLVEELRQRGDLDRTIVLVTADHGELLGEHGFEHGNNLYLPLLHVPLVIRAPGLVPAGVRVRPTVSLRDMAATIMRLVDSTSTASVSGHSLHVTWSDSVAGPTSLPASALTIVASDRDDPMREWILYSVVDDSLHYLRNKDDSELLFDVRTDPNERMSLHRDPAYGDALAGLRARLDSLLGGTP